MENRLYLPLEWLDEVGINVETFLENPKSTKALANGKCLVAESERLYVV